MHNLLEELLALLLARKVAFNHKHRTRGRLQLMVWPSIPHSPTSSSSDPNSPAKASPPRCSFCNPPSPPSHFLCKVAEWIFLQFSRGRIHALYPPHTHTKRTPVINTNDTPRITQPRHTQKSHTTHKYITHTSHKTHATPLQIPQANTTTPPHHPCTSLPPSTCPQRRDGLFPSGSDHDNTSLRENFLNIGRKGGGTRRAWGGVGTKRGAADPTRPFLARTAPALRRRNRQTDPPHTHTPHPSPLSPSPSPSVISPTPQRPPKHRAA